MSNAPSSPATESDVPQPAAGEQISSSVPFNEALRTFTRIGLLSFGGPTAQISVMHRILVSEKRWLDETHFLSALGFCMLLPGPEAMQLATYAGWRLHGVRGGLAAGLLFVLPGAAVVLALSIAYALYGNSDFLAAVFLGIKAAVLAVVIEALQRISHRALKGLDHWLLALAAFIAIYALAVPFPLIILAAGTYGLLAAAPGTPTAAQGADDATLAQPLGKTLRTALIWLAIWVLPLLALGGILGPGHVVTELGLLFSRLAVVTFGGAYTVLAALAQDVVTHYHWLSPGQMMDGLGLAETTPGPLILVTEFVGFLAAWRHGGASQLAMGLLGAAVALWATFAPCFLWIFVGAPYVAALNRQPRLRSALAAITAAVVGVILNLAVWFALNVFFARVAQISFGPLHVALPDIASLDWRAVVLAVVTGGLLLGRHWNIVAVLATGAALALGMRATGL